MMRPVFVLVVCADEQYLKNALRDARKIGTVCVMCKEGRPAVADESCLHQCCRKNIAMRENRLYVSREHSIDRRVNTIPQTQEDVAVAACFRISRIRWEAKQVPRTTGRKETKNYADRRPLAEQRSG